MAIPDYHKLGGLTEIYSHGSRGQKFAIKMLAGLVPSGGCFMPHSSLLVADGSPWCSWASRCISPVSARFFTSFPSVSWCLSLSLIRTIIIGPRAHSYLRWLHFKVLTVITSAKTLILNKITFWSSKWMYLLGSWLVNLLQGWLVLFAVRMLCPENTN